MLFRSVGWSPVTHAVSYNLYRNTENTLHNATFLTSTPNAILYTDTGLETETTYYYFVIAQATGFRDSAAGSASATTATADRLLIDPTDQFLINTRKDKIKIK